uniref:1,4-alpha-glucan branching enzyme GlgB n=1 Tax=Magnetococcus massalia (strain MO-1) TaxID=451514 RepID=A0A1S7LLS3_MAGMO|nr:GH13 : 1,4-alpha-glucan-branching enzyme [Candidatus Magnetococcus massalia]
MPYELEALNRLASGDLDDPFELLGRHERSDGEVEVLVYLPQSQRAILVDLGVEMRPLEQPGFFHWSGPGKRLPHFYRLQQTDRRGNHSTFYDPYAFPPQLTDTDMELFAQGQHRQAGSFLGAHAVESEGIPGIRFAVWAPHAKRVGIVGDFNGWNSQQHPMRLRKSYGIWELFIPDLPLPSSHKGVDHHPRYLYELVTQDGYTQRKADPCASAFQLNPELVSLAAPPSNYSWQDQAWLHQRSQHNWVHAPISIYEVELGSWLGAGERRNSNYRELGQKLADYCHDMGFSHVELLPLLESVDGDGASYQTVGFFAPTSRFGNADDFRAMVDQLHMQNIGVLLNWSPSYLPCHHQGLTHFDGTALYEMPCSRDEEPPPHGQLQATFDFGRPEVRSFLISSAIQLIQQFHLDGLRLDNVAAMLYLDYHRSNWQPNKFGGRENLEAIAFLRELSQAVSQNCVGVELIAEESTAWPQVTRPPELGGLGFGMKWNMGWVGDIMRYMTQDPIHRKYHHDHLTFSLHYSFSEQFILPFSHKEVDEEKGSLLSRMPGDEWQKFANLRLLFTTLFTHPGKKLLFMGNEIAQPEPWQRDRPTPWHLLEYHNHRGMQNLVRDLNQLFKQERALHGEDFSWDGFRWIDSHDHEQSIISFLRIYEHEELVIVLNFTPIPRAEYRIGVPKAGVYTELFNADSSHYGGSNYGNGLARLETVPGEWMMQPYSLVLHVPPMAGLILKLEAGA